MLFSTFWGIHCLRKAGKPFQRPEQGIIPLFNTFEADSLPIHQMDGYKITRAAVPALLV